MLSFSSLPQESKSNLYKARKENTQGKINYGMFKTKINYVMFTFMRALCGTHSVLNRRLMEFIHGGNGNVESLFISFALSSVCS